MVYDVLEYILFAVIVALLLGGCVFAVHVC
jgi:hypothetical protein